MQKLNIKKSGVDEAEENSVRDFLYKLLSHWPLFVILFSVTITGAWLYLRYKIPIYQSTATILIKDEKKGLDMPDVMQVFDLFGSKKIVDNEIEVLLSKTLAQEVVKNLHLYSPVLQKGRITDNSAYLSSPICIQVQNPDSMEESNRIFFTFDPAAKQINIGDKKYPLQQWVITDYGLLRFDINKNFRPTKSKKPFYFSLVSVKKAANDVIRRTKIVATSKQSTVIDLTITDEIPKRGEDILNELISVYNNAAVKDKNILATHTLQFVEDRLKYVVNELDSVEGSLQTFKSKNKIVDISAQGQIFLQTAGANDQKMSEISMKLAVLNQVENYVMGKAGSESIVPATLGIDDPVLSQLLEKLYSTQLEYDQIRKTVPDNNPMVVTLSDEIKRIRPGILENIRNQRKNLEAGRNNLSETNNRYASMLQTMPEKERELLGISRQQIIKNNIYTFLLQKREEAALSYASTIADTRVVDKAESTDDPISPKRFMIYLIAVAVAIGLGIGVIYAKEVLTRTIQLRSEIEKYTSVPFLGEVMHDNSKTPLVISEGKRTFIAEQFRHLRTSLGYLGINSKKKKILLTSTISGEGKSFITANLGVSLALMGKKVVLLEMDLRKPKLSDAFNLSRTIGITNYLIGQKDPEEIIKNTSVANLFVIPSGPIPPNPSELISNGKVQELFAFLETNFDYILIDTAPINPVTDAYILSPLCDATLYILRQGYTPKLFVQKIEENNKNNSLKNTALVFNGIKGKRFSNYGYGYGYGYGYTQEEKGKRKKKKDLSKAL